MTDKNQDVLELDINLLQPNPLQPRGVISTTSIEELTQSIKIHGVLEPLVAAKTPAGYQIIAGERRWRAAKSAGLKTVPVIVKETNPRGMLEMALVENVQREDLNCLERAQAYKRLLDEFGLPTTEIAVRVGKSVPYISNTMRLLLLPDAIKDGLFSGIISEGHARALLQLVDGKLMIDGYKIVLRDSASVRQTEELVRKMASQGATEVPRVRTQKILNPKLEEFEKELSKLLHGKVHISQSQVNTKVSFNFHGNLEMTTKKIEELVHMLKKIFA